MRVEPTKIQISLPFDDSAAEHWPTWERFTGQQQIIWYDCTHYGAVAYFVPAMRHVVQHLGAD